MARLTNLPPRLSAVPGAVGYSDRKTAERQRDKARRAAANLRGLYNTKRWRDPVTGLRAKVIARDGGACCMCSTFLIGKAPAPNSAVVDHITKPEGNLMLFWDEANLQAVCKGCHDGEKQRLEKAAEATTRLPGGGSKV